MALNLGNLAVSNYTLAMLVVWCIASIRNRQAFIMVVALVLYTAINAATKTNFHGFIITSAAFLTLAASNIRIRLSIRKAFLLFGAIYFIASIDQAIYYHFDFDTYFDRIQPYLVTAINAYVLAYLMCDGGRGSARDYRLRADAFGRSLFRLSLRKQSNINKPQ